MSLARLVKAVLICALIAPLAYCQEPRPTDKKKPTTLAKSPTEDELRRRLEESANKLLTIIQRGDPKQLLLFCSRKGVVFGVDEPAIRLSVIRKQIEAREGIYCTFFDTDCARRKDAEDRAKAGAPPSVEALYSYRERVVKAVASELRVSVYQIAGVWSGTVVVTLKGDVQPNAPMEFEFAYESGSWKLTALPLH